jgi:hypothetical protein
MIMDGAEMASKMAIKANGICHHARPTILPKMPPQSCQQGGQHQADGGERPGVNLLFGRLDRFGRLFGGRRLGGLRQLGICGCVCCGRAFGN